MQRTRVLTGHVYDGGVAAAALRVGDEALHLHVEHLPRDAGDHEHAVLHPPHTRHACNSSNLS